MSENETLPIEELPIEDKKKAVSLQDLIYVKYHMDRSHNTHKEEMNATQEAFANEMDAKHEAFKKDITDGNVKAGKAANADNASNADNADEATHAVSADEATHAANATEADHATNASNAVVNSDGSYSSLEQNGGVFSVGDNSLMSYGPAVTVSVPLNSPINVNIEPGHYYEFAGAVFTNAVGGDSKTFRSFFRFVFYFQSHVSDFTQATAYKLHVVTDANLTTEEQTFIIGSASNGQLFIKRLGTSGLVCQGNIRRIYGIG